MVWKPVWNERCSEILRRNAQHYTNSEIGRASCKERV